MKGVVILGSTGSIGVNALEVLARFPDLFRVVGLAAYRNAELLAQQVQLFQPEWCSLAPGQKPIATPGCRCIETDDRILGLLQAPEVDIVVNAIVGSAGLRGTLAALEAGKTVALANKESLVVAGDLVMRTVREKGGQLLPVDSEHSAIFQALRGNRIGDVERVVLTASGGPFRGRKRAELEAVTVEEALNHPTWKMGKKITVDSATMMNKALEMIEARWLFDLRTEQIAMIVHPESIVHSFVEYRDGSVMAQLSPPDMRLPIQYALLYPERPNGPARRLNWSELSALHFAQPDFDAFPAPLLAGQALRDGGTAGAVLNAANEAAVERFLAGEIRYPDILSACRTVLEAHTFIGTPNLEELLAADRWARGEVRRKIATRTG